MNNQQARIDDIQSPTAQDMLQPILTNIRPHHAFRMDECYYNMWQSQIEIEYYSVAYFEHITEFDAL